METLIAGGKGWGIGEEANIYLATPICQALLIILKRYLVHNNVWNTMYFAYLMA